MKKTARSLNNVKIFKGICDVEEICKGKAHCLTLQCSMNHLKGSMSKLGKTFDSQQAFFKKGMDLEEIFEDT